MSVCLRHDSESEAHHFNTSPKAAYERLFEVKLINCVLTRMLESASFAGVGASESVKVACWLLSSFETTWTSMFAVNIESS